MPGETDGATPRAAHNARAFRWWTWSALALGVCWVVAVAVVASNGGFVFGAFLLGVFASALLVLEAAGRLGFVVLSAVAGHAPERSLVRRLAVWSVTPAIGVLSVGLAATDYAAMGRIALAESSMRQQAEAALAGTPIPPGSRFGLYRAREAGVHGGAVRVTTTGDMGFITSAYSGLYYAPDGPPTTPPDLLDPTVGNGEEIRHLFGPWYRFDYWIDWF